MITLGAAGAPAGEAEYGADFTACTRAAAGNTAALGECIAAEHARQDRRLNESYAALRGALPAMQAEQLQLAQREWLAFRRLECRWRTGAGEGSAAALAESDCRLQLTAERAAVLAGRERALLQRPPR